MLTWLACRLAPRLGDFSAQTLSELPDPLPQTELLERARATFAELEQAPFRPSGELNPYKLLWGMGCLDLVTREADQNPELAGRSPTYAPFPAFQPVELPGADGVTLHGHHSTGAPGAPVVIVVHGLFDSHTSIYVVRHAEVLRRWGFHVVALDLRDHGRLRGRKPPLSLGLYEGRDLFQAAKTLSAAEGVSVGLLGLSYGGQCVVRAAYEASLAGEAQVLRGGVMSISAPLDILEGVNAFDDHSRLPRPSSLVDRLIMREVFAIFEHHLRVRVAELGKLNHPCRNYETYLRDAVIPHYPGEPAMAGAFASKARCTQTEVLGKIAVPTFLLHAQDDPLVPVGHLLQAQRLTAGNPWIATRVVPHGGHVALQHVDPAGTAGLLATFFGRLRDG